MVLFVHCLLFYVLAVVCCGDIDNSMGVKLGFLHRCTVSMLHPERETSQTFDKMSLMPTENAVSSRYPSLTIVCCLEIGMFAGHHAISSRGNKK